jgi:chromosome segregation ATPase
VIPPNFYQKRLQDLEDNIAKEQELLKDYEEALGLEDEPRRIKKYNREIERQRGSVTRYQQEFAELQQKLRGSSSAQMQMQKVGSQLQQMDAKLNILLSSQVVIYKNLNQMRQALLDRYDAAEQTIIAAIAEQLDRSQLVLTQNLLNALETNQVSEPEMQQMLAVLEERIPSLPPSQASVAEIIKAPEPDAKHKLKVTLPIIPMLVEYEGELELGSGFNIKSAWEQLITKLRRR